MHWVELVGLDLDAPARQFTFDRDGLKAALGKLRLQRLFLDARHWSATSWPPKSTAHHIGAQRLYSTVSEPAVDTNPAQHHLSSFSSQFVSKGFVGRRRRGAYDFGRRFSGFGHLESSPSQQILEEGFGRLILARRGRWPDGKRRAGNLKALGLSGGIDHDGRNTEAILGHRKLQPRQRRRFRACRDGCRAYWRMRRGHRHRWRQDTVADEPASQRRFIALSGESGCRNTEHAGGHLAEKRMRRGCLRPESYPYPG